MSSKTIKTILFASLIAAMILPLSSMDYAEAKKPDKYNISDKIDKLIVEFNTLEVERQALKAELRSMDSQEDNSVPEAQIESIEAEMDNIETEAAKLAVKEKRYNPSSSNDGVTINSITEGDTIYAVSTHTSCDSSSIPSSTNTATGAIDVNVDIIGWTWNVADAKSVGWFWPFCTNVYFEEILFNVRNNTVSLSCTITIDNQNVGDVIQTCNCGISNGDLLSWQVETTYEPLSGTNTEGNDDWRGLHRAA